MAVLEKEQLLTAEQFASLPDNGQHTELVRGRIVPLNPPKYLHGKVCANLTWRLTNHARENQLGVVVSNDTGVVTRRSPDTVRGADVAYYSYAKIPRDAEVTGYPAVPPDLIFEVLSPDDRWPRVLEKAAEYLQAGVTVVCAVDPDTRHVHVFRGDREPVLVTSEQPLTLPDVFPGFSVSVREFFV